MILIILLDLLFLVVVFDILWQALSQAVIEVVLKVVVSLPCFRPRCLPSPNSLKSKQITEAIANFLFADMRPFTVVESASFKQMIHILEPRYTVPSRDVDLCIESNRKSTNKNCNLNRIDYFCSIPSPIYEDAKIFNDGLLSQRYVAECIKTG